MLWEMRSIMDASLHSRGKLARRFPGGLWL